VDSSFQRHVPGEIHPADTDKEFPCIANRQLIEFKECREQPLRGSDA
jgi:hypothetical protein